VTLRRPIILMSALAVVSDAVLIAFYPQFFERRYGLTSSLHVGAYIAAISLAVMCTLPMWARVARHVDTMRLLTWTQCAAGVLCALSYWADSITAYWLLTMPMFMCKSSYLLMFPYLMRLEKPEHHSGIVGMLSVVVQLGGIFGAVVGGMVMQQFGPAACLWVMAAGDFAQMLVSRWLLRRGRVPRELPDADDARPTPRLRHTTSTVARLCLLFLVFDFGAYLSGPFFSTHWERVSGLTHQAVSGFVYAIPGLLALAAMLVNKHAGSALVQRLDRLQANLLLGAAGLALQATPNEAAMLLGRCLFGWAIFQVVVKLEVSVFKLSMPASYAMDYSIANFFQNLGVLLASFSAGAIVERFGIRSTFVVAALALLLTAWLDRVLLGVDRIEPAADTPPLPNPAHAN
jgi:predicted MFS family arabinose efflux permease